MNRSTAVFRCYLAFCALGMAGYFLLPQSAQNLALIASNLVCLTAILFAWRTPASDPDVRLAPVGGFSRGHSHRQHDLFRERQHSAR